MPKVNVSKLRDSFFFRRILRLLGIAILVWAILTYMIYGSLIRPRLVEKKTRELEQTLMAVGKYSSFNNSDLFYLLYILKHSRELFSSYSFFFPFDRKDPPVETLDGCAKDLPPGVAEFIRDEAQKVHLECLKNKGYAKAVVKQPGGGEYLIMAVPINNFTFGAGSLIMVQPLDELYLSFSSLNDSLIMAAIISLLLLIFPLALAAKRMMQPLIRIRNVAIAMTKGDFSMRANEEGENEISDLARAMNHMVSRIAFTLNQLTLERNQLQQIVNGISEGIIAVDKEGEITQINAMVWRMFGRDPKHYTPENLLKLHNLNALFMECLKDDQELEHTLFLEKEKKKIFCQITPLYDAEGKISAAVGLFRDITESDRLEQTRRDYIANVSHELRTPITAMRALLEPLHDGMVQKKEDRIRYYGILLRETMRLSRLIDDMLELSRLQSGKSSIRQGPLDTDLLFEELKQKFILMADDHGINFTAEKSAPEMPFIWGNRDRIEQILIIYFDNALKFTPEEGSIDFRLSAEEKQVVFRVTDTGPGISAEDMPFVFERFYKADKAHNETGTGLGLSIAKTLANQLGMNVSVSSTEGQGASFALGIHYAEDVMRADHLMKDVFDTEEEAGISEKAAEVISDLPELQADPSSQPESEIKKDSKKAKDSKANGFLSRLGKSNDNSRKKKESQKNGR